MSQDKNNSTVECIFCKIVHNTIQHWKVWETERLLAVLTPFPNTPGFTVLMTKEHHDSNIFSLDRTLYIELMNGAKELSALLSDALSCERTGMIVEGMGIDHAHIKLIPMHGIPKGHWKPFLSDKKEFNPVYQGFLSSQDGPKATNEEMNLIQQKITDYTLKSI